MVASVQATPVIFNKKATVEKAIGLIDEAARLGSKLIVFPESFIPAYPSGLGFGTVVGRRTEAGRDQFMRFWDESVDINGEGIAKLAKTAAKHGVYIVIGITEREPVSKTLFCTMVYIGADGSILGKHRKLKPTAAERLIWGEGDGSTLSTFVTEIGRIGGLICWENYMPLARMSMYKKGLDIYIAPTADYRDSWQSTMVHIACEGRCFVIGSNQYFTKSDYPLDLKASLPDDMPEILSRGGSVIVSPLGKVLAGPLYNEEGILTAEIDLNEVTRSRFDFDVNGHYNRPDVFKFDVNGQPEIANKTQVIKKNENH